jgi:hypothetical protein
LEDIFWRDGYVKLGMRSGRQISLGEVGCAGVFGIGMLVAVMWVGIRGLRVWVL